MKASELRIGNLLYDFTGGVFTVRGTTHDAVWVTNFGGPLTLTAVKPIPLTSEWLERFGFEMQQDSAPGIGVFTWWQKKGLQINETNVNGKQWFLIAPYLPAKHFRHVHQLQNLYFALTGTELTINDDGKKEGKEQQESSQEKKLTIQSNE